MQQLVGGTNARGHCDHVVRAAVNRWTQRTAEPDWWHSQGEEAPCWMIARAILYFLGAGSLDIKRRPALNYQAREVRSESGGRRRRRHAGEIANYRACGRNRSRFRPGHDHVRFGEDRSSSGGSAAARAGTGPELEKRTSSTVSPLLQPGFAGISRSARTGSS